MALPPAFSIASWAVLENLCAWTVTAVLISPLLRTLIRPFFLRSRPRAMILSRVNSVTFCGGGDLGDAVEAEDLVLDAEDVGEAALGQTAVKGHLAAFEAAHERGAGAGALTLVSAGRGLTHARTHTAADALLVFVRLLGGAEIGEITDCHCFPRYNAGGLQRLALLSRTCCLSVDLQTRAY